MEEEEELVEISVGLKVLKEVIDEKILVLLAEDQEAIEEFVFVVALLAEPQVELFIAAKHDALVKDEGENEKEQAREEHDEKDRKILLEEEHVA